MKAIEIDNYLLDNVSQPFTSTEIIDIDKITRMGIQKNKVGTFFGCIETQDNSYVCGEVDFLYIWKNKNKHKNKY